MDASQGKAAPAGMPQGRKQSRLRRVLKWAGLAAAAAAVIIIIAALIVLYKATRKFPLNPVDVTPPDAVAWIECESLATSWPGIMQFLETARKSPRYRTMLNTDPLLKDSGIDQGIEQALKAVEEAKSRAGVDPIEAALSYKTSLALFAEALPPDPRAPGAGGKQPPGAKFSFAAFTFLTGLKVRIAALFAETILSKAAPEGLEIAAHEGYTGLRQTSVKGSPELYFAIIKDLVVVSDNRRVMESILDLASAGLTGNLGSRPEFRDAMDAAGRSEDQFRFWIDFKAADALLKIREKSEMKVTTFPFVYLGRYMNGIQRGVVDLENTTAIAGGLRLDPQSCTVKVEGLMRYSQQKYNSFLMRTYGLEPAEPIEALVAPAGTACSFSVRKDFRELWDQLGYEGDSESRESFLKLSEMHSEFFSRIISGLGTDFAVFFKASPFYQNPRPGVPPPLPHFCLAASASDPAAVSDDIRGIFNAQIEKYASKAPPNEVPVLKSEKRGDASITYIDNLPVEVRSEISPDFRPGFYTRPGQIVVFTSLPFAYEVIAACEAGRMLASEGHYSSARDSIGRQSCLSVFVDGERLFSMMLSYRNLIAEEMRPLDWKEGNRIIEDMHGRNLPPDVMRKHQDSYEAAVKRKQGEIAAKLARRFENLKIVRTLALGCRYLADPQNKAPAGLGFSLALRLDLD